MDSLRNAYCGEEEDEDFETATTTTPTTSSTTATNGVSGDPEPPLDVATATPGTEFQNGAKEEPLGFDAMSEDEESSEDYKTLKPLETQGGSVNLDVKEGRILEGDYEDPHPKKQKPLSSLNGGASENSPPEEANGSAHAALAPGATMTIKKGKKKNSNVWTKPASRKGKKKGKPTIFSTPAADDTVFVTPAPRLLDKNDDAPGLKICLSKVHKAERVELSEDRMSAGSTKGFRMVRATRGVSEGAWYFEIRVVKLGESGHTRLGWSTEKGDLQAPVGYDGYSFGYRDVDGSKIHQAWREKYGEEGYVEGDVIGFYINLPEGDSYLPKSPQLIFYKGQRYVCAPDSKEDPPKTVPGSEISFYKNGIYQGVAFNDLYGGRYYPAASMYTLPNEPNCTVKFNFGPDFEFFPQEFNGRPLPRPMVEVPYHGYDNRKENGASSEKI